MNRHTSIILWMLVLLAFVVFVTSAREGRIHENAWGDACHELAAGRAIPGLWNTIGPCDDVAHQH